MSDTTVQQRRRARAPAAPPRVVDDPALTRRPGCGRPGRRARPSRRRGRDHRAGRDRADGVDGAGRLALAAGGGGPSSSSSPGPASAADGGHGHAKECVLPGAGRPGRRPGPPLHLRGPRGQHPGSRSCSRTWRTPGPATSSPAHGRTRRPTPHRPGRAPRRPGVTPTCDPAVACSTRRSGGMGSVIGVAADGRSGSRELEPLGRAARRASCWPAGCSTPATSSPFSTATTGSTTCCSRRTAAGVTAVDGRRPRWGPGC